MNWLNTFRREIKRIGSRRLYLLITLIFPILSMAFFIALFYKGVPRDLPVAVCDMDNSSMSRKLVRMIDATSSVSVANMVTDREEGHLLIKTGKVYGLVTIPENFEEKIYSSEQPNVLCQYNNVYLVAGGMVNKDVSTAVRTLSAGISITTKIKKGASEYDANISAMPVRVDGHILFNPYTNYLYYLATTFLPIMLLIFVLSGTVYTIGIEFKEGTAGEWLESGGGSIVQAVSGKLLPYLICWLIIAFTMNSIMFNYIGIPIQGSRFILNLNTVVFVLAYMATGIFMMGIFSSLRMALSMSSVYAALAFTFSGLTFPYAAMYPLIKALGAAFPFSHYLKVFIDQSLRGFPVQYSMGALAGLSLFLLLPFLTLKLMKKKCLTPSVWGKN